MASHSYERSDAEDFESVDEIDSEDEVMPPSAHSGEQDDDDAGADDHSDDDADGGDADGTAEDHDEVESHTLTPPKKRPTTDSESKTSSPATPPKKKRKMPIPPRNHTRSPAVKGLTIPFRAVKRSMKLDPDVVMVQNEAAMIVTRATELFLKKMVEYSVKLAKKKGRQTIRYEDVAETRVAHDNFKFLDMLLP